MARAESLEKESVVARRTIVELIDDIDGSEASTTVEFGLDGVTYEIDLSEQNAAALRADLSSWVEKARRSTAGRRTRSTGTRSRNSDTAVIREWAREQGMKVSDRGRVSGEIRRAYYQAHGK